VKAFDWTKQLFAAKEPKPKVEDTPANPFADTSNEVKPVQPPPTTIKAANSGVSLPPNISTQVDVARIQSILRASEHGEPYQLNALYRDMILGFPHLQAEWSKRKMTITGQPMTIVPYDVDNAEDVTAARVIEEMIDGCYNWTDGVKHLLDATLYPCSAVEKIYEPVNPASPDGAFYTQPIMYRLKSLAPVDYTLFCYRIPFLASQNVSNPVLNFDANEWEPWLRFFSVEPKSGAINWSTAEVYKPDKNRHIIHRGNFLSTSIPDSYGGQMRAILFFYLLATQGRDWMALYMQKYGSPFLVGKTNTQNQDSVDMLMNSFSMGQQLGAVVVNSTDAVEVVQASANDGANAHKTLIDICNREVSKVVIGQELSSTAKNTGMGSGVSELQGEVRDDFRIADMTKLADTLRKQLFIPYLRLNGYRGRAPHITWGGFRADQGLQTAQTLEALFGAGIRLSDDGLRHLNEKMGFELEKFDAVAEAAKAKAANEPAGDKKPAKKDE
jgi:phage gp29-like protein